jgi:hypothetical protein
LKIHFTAENAESAEKSKTDRITSMPLSVRRQAGDFADLPSVFVFSALSAFSAVK